MRAVIQRVSYGKVVVEGDIVGQIDKGLVVLIGIQDGDDKDVYKYMCDKLINLRVFEDNEDKMNLSLVDIDGGLLIIPNFTLYGDCRKGRRPSYASSAKPEEARRIFNEFCEYVKERFPKLQTGKFQADMDVTLLNDGPVTLLLDSDREF
jgi:D-tyrosyl-tRNA(Tyr) deacylase